MKQYCTPLYRSCSGSKGQNETLDYIALENQHWSMLWINALIKNKNNLGLIIN